MNNEHNYKASNRCPPSDRRKRLNAEKLKQLVTLNHFLACDVPGCDKNRVGLSNYCGYHRKVKSATGHPLQKKFLASRYNLERDQVKELVESNHSHTGIVTATKWLQDWLNYAEAAVPGTIAAEELQRLLQHGVTATQIFIEAASVFVFQRNNPFQFKNDDSLDIAVSLAILKLAPLAKKVGIISGRSTTVTIKAKVKLDVGKRIRVHLQPLFVNLLSAIERNKSQAEEVYKAMLSPLQLPVKLSSVTFSGAFISSRMNGAGLSVPGRAWM